MTQDQRVTRFGHASIEPTSIGDVVVVRIEGEIDISNARNIGKDLLDRVDPDAVGLVVDLAGVRYLDSAGIRMLFSVAEVLTGGRRHLALSVPETSPVRRLFAVTSVDRAAHIEASPDDAARAVERAAEPG